MILVERHTTTYDLTMSYLMVSKNSECKIMKRPNALQTNKPDHNVDISTSYDHLSVHWELIAAPKALAVRCQS